MKHYLKLSFKRIPKLTGQLCYKSTDQGYVNIPASSSPVEAILYRCKHDNTMSTTVVPQFKYQHDPGSGLNLLYRSCKSANRPQCDEVDTSSVLKNGTMKRGEANLPQCDGVDISSATKRGEAKSLQYDGVDVSSVVKNGTTKRGEANSPQCDGMDTSSVLKNGTIKRGEVNLLQYDGVDVSSVLIRMVQQQKRRQTHHNVMG